MSKETQSSEACATLTAKNIGGISSGEAKFSPGVNVLAGRNATNRTSLLQAVIGALGGSNVSLKGDAERGKATLTLDGETYSRELVRNEQAVMMSGEPLLEDAETADLFAFLVEANEVRRSVARAENLRELIMAPVDTDEIEANIRRLKRRQDELDAEIREIDEEEDRLVELIQKRSSLEETIQRKKAELDDVRSLIADEESQSGGRDDIDAELEAKLDERKELESTREDVVFDLQTERESLESLRAELQEIEQELEEIPDVSEESWQDVETRLNRARERQNTVESTINRMQNIIQFNEEQLDDDEGLFGEIQPFDDGGLFASLKSEASTDLLGTLRTETGDGSVTDQLVDDQRMLTCWTCGSQVKKSRIERMIGELRDVRTDQVDLLREVETEIQELKERKTSLEETRRQRDRLERKRDQLSREIDTRRERIDELETNKATLDAEIESISEEIDSLRATLDTEVADEYDEIMDHREDAKRLELEIERHQDELDDVAEEIEIIEERIEQRDEFETERTELRERRAELRQRVDRIEKQAVNEFNERMAELLDILEYANIERIWIERIVSEADDGHGPSTDASFDIHIVRRTTDEARSYRDTIDHLSESEREVTGLVFALAGYLVHEVHESMPFMILDSLEAIDSNRIARLIEYLSSYAEYLVVALLPEDAAALDDGYRYLSPPW